MVEFHGRLQRSYGMTQSSPAVVALTRADWQPALFGRPRRAELAALAADWPLRRVLVRVHRNHAIEPVVSAMPAFAAWNGLRYEWRIGEYDDSLTFDAAGEADIELLWLDLDRYSTLETSARTEWLADRVGSLRAISTRPIVIAAFPLAVSERERLIAQLPRGVHVADLASIESALAAPWVDPRTASISGTRLSNAACIALARELACRWLPASVQAPVKAIAVDLDGTLYDGVLGEDGVHGVQMSEKHRVLQERLRDLHDEGVFLALVSRNERADVEALFAARTDFALELADFSAVEISWDDKASALARIGARLRIGEDAIVFVDDNPGELAAVAARTGVVTVHALPDAALTAATLDHVAGVFRWVASREDSLRADDLRAAEQRDALARAPISDDEYLRSLGVRLEYHVGAREHLPRAAELVRKTNQFNLSLRRLNEVEIERRLAGDPGNVVVVRLVDRLSDSGIVGVFVGDAHDGVLRIEELCISCRALGRRLEDALIGRALLSMCDGRPIHELQLDVAVGPRNAPAREWLARYARVSLEPDVRSVALSPIDVAARPVPEAVAITVARDPVTA